MTTSTHTRLFDFVTGCMHREGASGLPDSMVFNIAAVSLAAASHGHEVVHLYRHFCQKLPLPEQKKVQRRMKEAFVKTALFYGTPKALQALFPLFKDLGEEEVDVYGPRWERINGDIASPAPLFPTDLLAKGQTFFQNLWGPTAAAENSAFNLKHCPDLHFLVTWGLTWIIGGEDTIFKSHETCMLNAAASICSMNGGVAMWHVRGVVRQGGTMEQAKLAQDVGLGIKEMFRDEKPPGDLVVDFDQIDFEDRKSHARTR